MMKRRMLSLMSCLFVGWVGAATVLSQRCVFESFGVCKSLNLREPIFGFPP
jgi:hypothetical protein